MGSLENHPINKVLWIPVEKVQANDYNPNRVANREMHLLYLSIKNDGYTQPIVTIYDKKKDKYIIVDGFHRYLVIKRYKDIYESTNGLLPCVIIKKNMSERMASTIRHNRARGKHSIDGMSNLVFKMLHEGQKDVDICNKLGLEADELIRLKYVSGFAKLFESIEYKKAWETQRQIELRKKQQNKSNEIK